MWSTPTDLAKLLIAIARAFRGERPAFLGQATARAMLTRQSVGPYGLGGAVDGAGSDLVLMKRGQNVGYQSYMLIFPVTGQGMAVMTGSDNGTPLATALFRRAAAVYRWRRSAHYGTDRFGRRVSIRPRGFPAQKPHAKTQQSVKVRQVKT
ncbi:MAG: serine hydrolase [Rhodoplanes sp.]